MNPDAPRPTLAHDEVLVRVRATSVNPVDCAARSGYGYEFFSRIGWGQLPWILGRDVSGDIVELGKSVAGFELGDAVYAAPPLGCYAEYVAVKAEHVAPKPKNMTHAEAASLPFIALTTWSALVNDAGMNGTTAVGKKVVVSRAAGGVGSFAIQLLKAWGAEVAGICSTRNVGLVRDLGADIVVDYTRDDFRDRLSNYDLAFDLLGRSTDFEGIDIDYKAGVATADDSNYDEQLVSVLQSDGGAAYSTICSPKVAFTNKYGLDDGLRLAREEYDRRAATAAEYNVAYYWSFFNPDGAALRETTSLVERGLIHAVVDRTYSLDEIVDAHEYCESKQARGKIVVEVTDQEDSDHAKI